MLADGCVSFGMDFGTCGINCGRFTMKISKPKHFQKVTVTFGPDEEKQLTIHKSMVGYRRMKTPKRKHKKKRTSKAIKPKEVTHCWMKAYYDKP
jgi:hypothetical protein